MNSDLKAKKINKIAYHPDSKIITADTKRSTPLVPSTITSIIDAVESKGEGVDCSSLIKEICYDAHYFDFGVITNRALHESATRSHSLFCDSALDLPFDSVIFKYIRTFEDDTPDEDNIVFIKKTDRGVKLSSFCKIKEGYSAIITSGLDIEIFKSCTLEKGRVRFSYRPLFTTFKDLDNYYDEKYLLGYLKHLHEDVFGPLLILNTRYITNKESTEKNLFDYRNRDKELGNKCINIDGQLYSDLATKTKGSNKRKAPHLRRGHIRKLKNGQSIWVRDCVVNIPSSNGVFKNKQRYKVVVNEPISTGRKIANNPLKTEKISYLSRFKKLISW